MGDRCEVLNAALNWYSARTRRLGADASAMGVMGGGVRALATQVQRACLPSGKALLSQPLGRCFCCIKCLELLGNHATSKAPEGKFENGGSESTLKKKPGEQRMGNMQIYPSSKQKQMTA
jgi:hypothetical protein